MARRRRNSAADDWVDLVALMPWWAGLGLAVVSFLVLRSLANMPLPSVVPGQGASHLVTASIWRGMALAGQYIVPLVCVIGAIVLDDFRHAHHAGRQRRHRSGGCCFSRGR